METDYWDLLDVELKNSKNIYHDDTKRFNRIDNLKLRMVKELLFDKYINMLTEPKPKKIKKIKEILTISNNIDFDNLHNFIVNLNVIKKKDTSVITTTIKILITMVLTN